MPDPAEVAIESALLNHVIALCASPSIPLALPNVAFVPPTPGQNVYWYRATLLPADSFGLGVDYSSSNQHFGLLQVDVFYGQGAGELAPGRLASAIMTHFVRGTRLSKDGFAVEIFQAPFRGRMIKDDPWVMIPVSIPYKAFASNPA